MLPFASLCVAYSCRLFALLLCSSWTCVAADFYEHTKIASHVFWRPMTVSGRFPNGCREMVSGKMAVGKWFPGRWLSGKPREMAPVYYAHCSELHGYPHLPQNRKVVHNKCVLVCQTSRVHLPLKNETTQSGEFGTIPSQARTSLCSWEHGCNEACVQASS